MNARTRRSPSRVEPPTLVRLYLDEVSYHGSRRTFDNYRLDLERRFLPYLASVGVKDITGITRAHCAGFISQEATRGVGRYSVRKSFDVMRRWLNWCVESGYLNESPAARMKAPKLPKSLRQGFTREEVTKLLSTSREGRGFLAFRDHAIVLMLVGTGMRAEGLLSLTVSQFNSPAYRANRQLVVREKGSRERIIPVGKNARRAVGAYLAVRPAIASDALWVTLRREPMEYSALAAMMTKLGEYSGVENVIAHRFRHTFAAEHYRANRDIMALKAALGHSDIGTTEQYLRALGIDYATAAKAPNPDEWLA